MGCGAALKAAMKAVAQVSGGDGRHGCDNAKTGLRLRSQQTKSLPRHAHLQCNRSPKSSVLRWNAICHKSAINNRLLYMIKRCEACGAERVQETRLTVRICTLPSGPPPRLVVSSLDSR